MGIIQSGILSKVSGKVAGVVGGSWKDKAYLRAWVTPANPNTAAQQAQRGKFSLCVGFAKLLVGQVFNPYTDPFQRKMSGYNYFIRSNIDKFVAPISWDEVVITSGKLAALGGAQLSRVGSTFTITYSTLLGQNGAADDVVFAGVCRPNEPRVWFAAATATRDDGSIDVEGPSSGLLSDHYFFVFAAQYVGTQLKLISESLLIQGIDP